MSRSSPSKDPPRRHKADRTVLIFSAIVGFVLFSSTLLLCDVSGVKPGDQWPWLVDRLLAVPVQLTDLSDLRYYAVPVGLALLLVLLPIRISQHGRVSDYWFEMLAAATLLWACTSAWSNGSWEQSRGWLFWLACGLGWAAALGRVGSVSQVKGALAAASIVAIVAAGLSLAHRQALGERFFQLPVGPITLTASLGALWTAMGSVWLVGAVTTKYREISTPTPTHRRSSKDPHEIRGTESTPFPAILWGTVVSITALFLLLAANRRGAWMGLLAAWAAVSGMVLWERCRTRTQRAILIVAALVALVGAAWYVRGQARSSEVAASLPLRVRSIYWQTMLKMIPDAPVWGAGPDRFVIKATTAQALQRAEEPKILHGTVDFDGHNEWLQAAFELGIPGALMYVALPIGAIVVGSRRWRQLEASARVMILALLAGLIEICVAEASSINLRSPILPGWYWTILGLTVALGRHAPFEAASTVRGSSQAASRAMGIIAAVAILALVAVDVRAAIHHAQGRAQLLKDDAQAEKELELAVGRFGAGRWLSSRNYLAAARSNQLRAHYETPVAASLPASDRNDISVLGRRAIEAWRELWQACPGYLDTGFRLAEAQMMIGDLAAARATLEIFLRDIHPYDKQGNILFIQIGELDAAGKLECVRRALRADQWEEILLATATESLKSPMVASAWPARVEQALRDVGRPVETDWVDPLAPETLRVEAFRRIGQGDLAGAERVQVAAAEAYDRIARKYAAVRRKWPAEVDAWYLAAQFLFLLDSSRYQEAFERVQRAEFYVIDSIPSSVVPNAAPSAELVGGRIMPMEMPDKLARFWRFSAMMHLIMKKDPGQINLRINWSLPADARTPERTYTEVGRLAVEIVKTYETRPEASRPPSYSELVGLARKMGTP
ncbi:MAG TPA: O-antigen ligase family protein [Phycisphaerae bacterium]|nr:O-antigen ligase family protein [Phycisphaerae bacterium]